MVVFPRQVGPRRHTAESVVRPHFIVLDQPGIRRGHAGRLSLADASQRDVHALAGYGAKGMFLIARISSNRRRTVGRSATPRTPAIPPPRSSGYQTS